MNIELKAVEHAFPFFVQVGLNFYWRKPQAQKTSQMKVIEQYFSDYYATRWF